VGADPRAEETKVSVTDWASGNLVVATAATYLYGIDAKGRPTTKAFADQATFEEEAVRLIKQDPQKGRALLTKYSHDIANGAVSAYWTLAEDLWSKYTNFVH
jgi:hypothetical protein